MYWLRFLVIAALIACASACTTLPKAMQANEGDVRAIHWTKDSDAKAFRDQHGVCRVFSRDSKTSLQTLGEQLLACFDGTLPLATAPAAVKSVDVVWNKISRARMAGVYAEATGQGSVKGFGGGWQRADRLFAVRGFFMYAGSTCHVVVPEDPDYVGTLGHEFKHCVDGYFHDGHGAWYNAERER